MKRPLLILSLMLLLTAGGCASSDELKYVTRSLDTKIAAVQGSMTRLQESVEKNTAMISENRELITRSDESSRSFRKSQADAGADLITLRDEVQKLRGAVEELKFDVKNFRASSAGALSSDQKNSLDQMEARLRSLEGRTKIASSGGTAPAPPVKKGVSAPPPPAEEKPDSEQLYSDAYKIFVDRDYEAAKAKFQEFLKNFPDTEYSDNAQFWIAECFYFQDKFEEAILEYEKVIQNYPKGNKVPNALLKQALSFLKLDDKASSRLLLQRVVKDYPGTTPAEIARAKLLEIK